MLGREASGVQFRDLVFFIEEQSNVGCFEGRCLQQDKDVSQKATVVLDSRSHTKAVARKGPSLHGLLFKQAESRFLRTWAAIWSYRGPANMPAK